MLVRLTLCAALLATLGGCASYDSSYYRDDVVYQDGSYYAPAADGEGDYYYAPEDDSYGYGGWNGWGYGPAYPSYFLLGPGYGVAGFDGYCSVAYPACLPWWTGSYIDPRYRFWIGFGRGTGWPPYRSHDRGWDRDRDRDRDRWHRDNGDHGRPPRPAPSPAPDIRPSRPPDLSQPAPVERMPRPVIDRRDRDWHTRPVPPEPVPHAVNPAPDEVRPAPRASSESGRRDTGERAAPPRERRTDRRKADEPVR